MADLKDKKLSRRDAIKLLGAAAGASVLVNLPSKWSSPEIVSGVIPAHAQTSCLDVLSIEVISAEDCTVGIVANVGTTPTSAVGTGSAGSIMTWDCAATGCVAIGFGLQNITGGNPAASLLVTTISEQFVIVIGQTDEFLLVDLDTGATDQNFANPSAGSCDWPFVKSDGKPHGWGK